MNGMDMMYIANHLAKVNLKIQLDLNFSHDILKYTTSHSQQIILLLFARYLSMAQIYILIYVCSTAWHVVSCYQMKQSYTSTCNIKPWPKMVPYQQNSLNFVCSKIGVLFLLTIVGPNVPNNMYRFDFSDLEFHHSHKYRQISQHEIVLLSNTIQCHPLTSIPIQNQ